MGHDGHADLSGRVHPGDPEREPDDHRGRHVHHRVRRHGAAGAGRTSRCRSPGSATSSATFGGLSRDSGLGYAVRDFFTNGGSSALVVRVVHEVDDPNDPNDVKAAPAQVKLGTSAEDLVLEASGPGAWANVLEVDVEPPDRCRRRGHRAGSGGAAHRPVHPRRPRGLGRRCAERDLPQRDQGRRPASGRPGPRRLGAGAGRRSSADRRFPAGSGALFRGRRCRRERSPAGRLPRIVGTQDRHALPAQGRPVQPAVHPADQPCRRSRSTGLDRRGRLLHETTRLPHRRPTRRRPDHDGREHVASPTPR